MGQDLKDIYKISFFMMNPDKILIFSYFRPDLVCPALSFRICDIQ